MEPFEYCLLGLGAIAMTVVCVLALWVVRKSQMRMERIVLALEAIVATQQLLSIESDEEVSQAENRSVALLEEQTRLQQETIELLKKMISDKNPS